MAHDLVTQVHNPNDPDEVELNDNHVQYVNQNAPPPHRDSVVDDVKLANQSCWSGFLRGLVKFLRCRCMKCCQGSAPKTQKKQPPLPPRPSEQQFAAQPIPQQNWLLPPLHKDDRGKKTLVLDLDETLVHSSFKPVPNADFVISIELEKEVHHVYVLKRPGVDEFLQRCALKYELVVFTASLNKYADPLLDILDPQRLVRARLFREACVQHYGNYVKDLSVLGRELNQTIIIDNSPYSYIFQPDNAIPISSWFNDQDDRQLLDLIPILDAIADADDVVVALSNKAFTTRHMQTYHSIDSTSTPSGVATASHHGLVTQVNQA